MINIATDTNTVVASVMILAADSVEAAASAFNGSQPVLVSLAEMAQKHFRGLSVTPIAVHFPSPVSVASLAAVVSSELGPHL